jgi:GT2 family glycosyltransferase
VTLSIAVVITSFNTRALALRCLDGVARFKGDRPVEVAVVDDASTEPAEPPWPAWIDLCVNPTNQGYVRSVNIGVRRTHADGVLLLDSDAAPLGDVFSPVAAAFAARPRLGALGFRLVDAALGHGGDELHQFALDPGRTPSTSRLISSVPLLVLLLRISSSSCPACSRSCAFCPRRDVRAQLK